MHKQSAQSDVGSTVLQVGDKQLYRRSILFLMKHLGESKHKALFPQTQRHLKLLVLDLSTPLMTRNSKRRY